MTKRIVLAACMAACVPHSAFVPATVAAKPGAFDRVTRALLSRGESIETKDESAGVIVTKWDEKTSMGTTVRMRWNVTVDGNSLTVNSQCQSRITDSGPMSGPSDWQDCGAQPDERSATASKIATEAK